jgi:hypothetical protein
MRNIRRRLKELSKSFPPPEDTGPELCVRRRSNTSRPRISSSSGTLINAQQGSSPARPLNEHESRTLEST